MEWITWSKNISISHILSRFFPQFQEIHWPTWTNQLRDWVICCVQRLMKCWSRDLWFATYQCRGCKKTHILYFTCKRSVCSSCSKPRIDKWINDMSLWLPTNISYFHFTFTLPIELRDLWLKYREYWSLSILFDQVHAIIIKFFQERFWCKPWIFSIIHTFWSAVNRNPHIHCVLTCWWITTDDQWNESRIDIEGKYISYKSFVSRRRTCVIKECRKLVATHDPASYDQRDVVFKSLFLKSRYVTVSSPIIQVANIMSYVTRYMYRPPVSLCNITNINDTWDIHTSTITLKFYHKSPRELRTITYTMLEFIWLLARQIPNKYARTIRYGWIFLPQVKKKHLATLAACTRHRYAPKLYTRPRKFTQRIQQSFWHNPLHCSACNIDMMLTSITYFTKKTQTFVTKHFDTS